MIPPLKKPQGRGKEEFFSMLVYGITFFKLTHWNRAGQGAFASHIALAETYDELSNIVDDLIESTQGEEELIFDLVIPTVKAEKAPFDFTKELLAFIRGNRKIFEHSWQQNEIDNIEKLLNKLKYKLKFLK